MAITLGFMMQFAPSSHAEVRFVPPTRQVREPVIELLPNGKVELINTNHSARQANHQAYLKQSQVSSPLTYSMSGEGQRLAATGQFLDVFG